MLQLSLTLALVCSLQLSVTRLTQTYLTESRQLICFAAMVMVLYLVGLQYSSTLFIKSIINKPTQLTRIPHRHQVTTANSSFFFSVYRDVQLSSSIDIQRDRHSPDAFPGKASCRTTTATALATSVSVVSIGA
jgi:uncharacterized membrane protein